MAGDGMDESYSPISVDVKELLPGKVPPPLGMKSGENGLENAAQKNR